MKTKYEVNKPFPGAYPTQEGAIMEVGPGGGFYLFIQFPGLTRPEKQAFKKGFKQYSYLETSTPVPIAVWVFDWPKPFGHIDTNFNARPVPADRIKAFTESEEGQVKNLLQVFLLDGNILKGIKAVGLDPEAVRLFHSTIRKQLETEYKQVEYDKYLNGIYQYSSDELLRMGKQFRMVRGKT